MPRRKPVSDDTTTRSSSRAAPGLEERTVAVPTRTGADHRYGVRRDGRTRGVGRLSGSARGRREELERDPVWVSERQARAVGRIHDPGVGHVEVVEPGRPLLEL